MSHIPNRTVALNQAQIERPKGEIEIATCELTNAVDRLTELTSKLQEVLTPVLGPPHPEKPNEQLKKDHASSLGSFLFGTDQRVRDINAQLNVLLDRICL